VPEKYYRGIWLYHWWNDAATCYLYPTARVFFNIL